uniref:Uncharacterized protein n=1 Tax=Amphimedon queenslandica TaxID=400682 RepID=A0A1X7VGM2_AMPQE
MVDLFYPVYALKRTLPKARPVKALHKSSPVLDPTTWETFTTAKSSTTLATFSKEPTAVFLKSCFMSPKHQSGENFSMPNGKKGDLDRFIPVCQYSLGQILNKSNILILTCKVVSICQYLPPSLRPLPHPLGM